MKVLTEERSWFHHGKAGRFHPPLLLHVRSPQDLPEFLKGTMEKGEFK